MQVLQQLEGLPLIDLEALVGQLEDAEPWQADALCREPAYAAVNWFPGRGESPRPAVEICERCLVASECLGYALAHGLGHGIWGGTSERQRRRLRKPAAAA